MGVSIWDQIDSVYLTSFWGWSPETWGTVGFTFPGRRETIIRETTDPFLMVVYVTKGAGTGVPNLDGSVAGFYVVSHVAGDRNEFVDPMHHAKDVESWRYSLKATRAFSFVPEYRLTIDQFEPSVKTKALSVSRDAMRLRDASVAKLRAIPYGEVPIYGGAGSIGGEIVVPDAARQMVRAGPPNRAGYTVPGEPVETEKELYVLALTGDTTAFLGKNAGGRTIFKVGLSLSPYMRLEAFRKSLPRGAFDWIIRHSTRRDGEQAYPNFEAALEGEKAMKASLGASSDWLGGEFYAATPANIEAAWSAGRSAARAKAAII